MTRIKIAHVTTVSSSLRGLLLNQLQNLSALGEIVGISAPGPEVPDLEAGGVRHIAIPIARAIAPLSDLKSIWRLYRVMRRERFAVVHTHLAKPALLGQLAAKLARVPVIINTVHGFYFHENMARSKRRFFIGCERVAASCSDLILSQNAEDVETAVREGICPRDRIRHIGNGIALDLFDPSRIGPAEIACRRRELGLEHGDRVVGFVGRLAAQRKGFLDFLRAAERIRHRVPQVRFLIIGASDHGKADAVDPSIASRYDVADRCLFLGFRPNTELPLLYKLMDVLVLPSPFEGIPRTVMEASAMGVPAVVTDVRGNREAVIQGRNGLLVPWADVGALADATVHVLTHPDDASRMGEEGPRVARERFDERQVFARIRVAYEQLLDGFQLDGKVGSRAKNSSRTLSS